MESRIQRIFLIRLLLAAILLSASTWSLSQEEEVGHDDDKTILDAVIEPDLDRRKIDEDRIDSENFEFGFYAGVMSVEDFGSNNVSGLRLAFHISEDWFLEGIYGITEFGETSAETINNINFIVEDDRPLEYYNLSLGVNLFPGEIFLGNNYAFNSTVFLILGAGNTKFGRNEHFTYNFGGGFRMFVTDWLAFRLDFRNHIFTHNVLPEEKTVQNLETHLGLSLYF